MTAEGGGARAGADPLTAESPNPYAAPRTLERALPAEPSPGERSYRNVLLSSGLAIVGVVLIGAVLVGIAWEETAVWAPLEMDLPLFPLLSFFALGAFALSLHFGQRARKNPERFRRFAANVSALLVYPVSVVGFLIGLLYFFVLVVQVVR